MQGGQAPALAVLTREKVRLADPIDQVAQDADLKQDLDRLERNRDLRRKIEAALARLEDGSYGYCLESGEEIGLERLMALPVATLSVERQERRQKLRGV